MDSTRQNPQTVESPILQTKLAEHELQASPKSASGVETAKGTSLTIVNEIHKQLERLHLHPVNLQASLAGDGRVMLNGSLLSHWAVPRVVDGARFLSVLNELPDAAGPRTTMEAFCAAQFQNPAPAD